MTDRYMGMVRDVTKDGDFLSVFSWAGRHLLVETNESANQTLGHAGVELDREGVVALRDLLNQWLGE